ncbi:hypothetical protein C2845_PM04G11780 [Panicum miliaceum]|uniref:Uncharacterized protein n=1 Tax=Panicum miliaceum TaxID=4540 RepID=A0A3L6QR72_PANMI|nr:hypothetical protein C2845_PM04G11780 [Panicum miliaceum]
MAMELEDDETAIGQFLHIKVRLDIRKPLMRGATLHVGDDEKPIWCPLVYEFLPDFCYTCWRIGHLDKCCEVVLKDGETQQFSKDLRFIPKKKRWDAGSSDRSGAGRYIPPRRNNGRGSGRKVSGGRSGSDSLSWKKDDLPKDGKKGSTSGGEEEEVTNPIKTITYKEGDGTARKALFLGDGGEEGVGEREKLPANMKAMQVDVAEDGRGSSVDEVEKVQMQEGLKEKKRGTYKRRPREVPVDASNMEDSTEVGRKRTCHDLSTVVEGVDGDDGMEVLVAELAKKTKLAGLENHFCAKQ